MRRLVVWCPHPPLTRSRSEGPETLEPRVVFHQTLSPRPFVSALNSKGSKQFGKIVIWRQSPS